MGSIARKASPAIGIRLGTDALEIPRGILMRVLAFKRELSWLDFHQDHLESLRISFRDVRFKVEKGGISSESLRNPMESFENL